MATPTKKGIKKVPPAAWVLGGVVVLGGAWYFYKKKKEEEKPTNPTESPYTGEELRNQSFIPVIGTNVPGAGSRYYPPETLPIFETNNKELIEHFEEALKTNAQSNKEQRESSESVEKERRENENTLIQGLIEQFKTSQSEQTEMLKQQIEASKALTGGGSPGTTDSGANNTGGSPTNHTVGATQAASTAVSNITKALFGGRQIVHPNEPDSYIVSAKGQHCPNTEWNRDHPKQMRGCK